MCTEDKKCGTEGEDAKFTLTPEEMARARQALNNQLVPMFQEMMDICKRNKIAIVFAAYHENDDKDTQNSIHGCVLGGEIPTPQQFFAAEHCLGSENEMDAIAKILGGGSGSVHVLGSGRGLESMEAMLKDLHAHLDDLGIPPARKPEPATTAG